MELKNRQCLRKWYFFYRAPYGR